MIVSMIGETINTKIKNGIVAFPFSLKRAVPVPAWEPPSLAIV